MFSGPVRTPRARDRYAASARRSSGRPWGSPGPKASVGASARARRALADQAPRGKEAGSGLPWSRSWRGPSGAAGAGAAGAAAVAAPSATRVPEPCRAVNQPSATSSA